MLTRRETLRGGTAAVAAIAAAGAVAGATVPAIEKSATSRNLPTAVDPAIKEAAKVYWARNADYLTAIDKPDHTDEEADAAHDPKMEAYDELMALPATGLAGLAVKVAAYRNEFWHCAGDNMDADDLDGILADLERLAGEVSS